MTWTSPADWNHHGVVFDLFEVASVHQSLQHRLPGLKSFHSLIEEAEMENQIKLHLGDKKRKKTFVIRRR